MGELWLKEGWLGLVVRRDVAAEVGGAGLESLDCGEGRSEMRMMGSEQVRRGGAVGVIASE